MQGKSRSRLILVVTAAAVLALVAVVFAPASLEQREAPVFSDGAQTEGQGEATTAN